MHDTFLLLGGSPYLSSLSSLIENLKKRKLKPNKKTKKERGKAATRSLGGYSKSKTRKMVMKWGRRGYRKEDIFTPLVSTHGTWEACQPLLFLSFSHSPVLPFCHNLSQWIRLINLLFISSFIFCHNISQLLHWFLRDLVQSLPWMQWLITLDFTNQSTHFQTDLSLPRHQNGVHSTTNFV